MLQHEKIKRFLADNGIETRPEAGLGLWMMFLLPAALIVTIWSQPVITTPTYKLASVFSLGLILASIRLLYGNSTNKLVNYTINVLISSLFVLVLRRGLFFSIWSAFYAVILYQKLLLYILKKLPKCFTLGEAAVCAQSYILLLYFSAINSFNYLVRPTGKVFHMSTLIIQIGLLGISAIIALTYYFQTTSAFQFYAISAIVFTTLVLTPLQVLFQQNVLLWMLNLIWDDLQKDRIVIIWIVCCVFTLLVIKWKITKAQKASTAIRKVFHILLSIVYILGLLYNCALLYLATGIFLGIFFYLEVLRILNLPPIGPYLQSGLVIFADQKDLGIMAFTPMYLLAGCCLPIWLHPTPCDVTNSATFYLLPLLSGVLTTGIGDTAASIVGYKLGRFHWPGSSKTIEGTIACILSQLLVIYILIYLGYLRFISRIEEVKVLMVVIFTSLVEAKTDQIDNLALPFIMYIILMF